MTPHKNSLVVLRNGRLAVWGQAVHVNGVRMCDSFYAFDLVTNQPISANRHDVAAVVGPGAWDGHVIDAPRDHNAGLVSPEGLAQRSGLGTYEPGVTRSRYNSLYVLYEEQPEGQAKWWAYDGQPFNATGPLGLWPIARITGGLQPDGPG